MLTRAIADKTAKPKNDDDSSGGNGGRRRRRRRRRAAAPAAAPTSGDADAERERAQRDPDAAPGRDPGIAIGPATAAGLGRRSASAAEGRDRSPVDVKQVSPGADRLSADVGRNALPGTLVGVLALIAAAAFALVAVPFVRTPCRRSLVASVGATSDAEGAAERSSQRSTSPCRAAAPTILGGVAIVILSCDAFVARGGTQLERTHVDATS